MKHTLVISLLSITLLLGCKSDNKKYIELFNQIHFQLNEGETTPKLDRFIHQEYLKLLPKGQSNIPLFKYIHHNDYGIFIGLPYHISTDSVNSSIKTMCANKKSWVSSTADGFTYNCFISDKTQKIHTLCVELNQTKLLIIARVNKNQDTTINFQSLKNRVQIKKVQNK